MFVQVVEAQVSEAQQVRAALDQWVRELAPGASGWLGSTAGVTADGRFVAVVRFESEEAAARNSSRPEQDQWWTQTSRLFAGEATFRDSTEVDVDMAGNADKAGFVQVIKGRGSDPTRLRELMAQNPELWAQHRPDIIGSVSVAYPDGGYTAVIYFTSEAEAREGERKKTPAGLKAQVDEMSSLEVGEPTFLDLKDPWLSSPS